MRLVIKNGLRKVSGCSAILAVFLLAACGQKGPLYLPHVPPLPPPPDMTASAPPAVASDAAASAVSAAPTPASTPSATRTP